MAEKAIEKEKISLCQLNWVLRLFQTVKDLVNL